MVASYTHTGVGVAPEAPIAVEPLYVLPPTGQVIHGHQGDAFGTEQAHAIQRAATQQAQLSYSRTIGLTDSGVAVPMYGGARLYGRAGPWTIGLLDARTGGVAEANNPVVRVRHDLFDHAWISPPDYHHDTARPASLGNR